MSEKSKNYDAVYEHYRGTRRYTVAHPSRKRALTVAAPDEASAIVAAADKWKVRWQSYEFYAYCDVSIKISKKRSAKKVKD